MVSGWVCENARVTRRLALRRLPLAIGGGLWIATAMWIQAFGHAVIGFGAVKPFMSMAAVSDIG